MHAFSFFLTFFYPHIVTCRIVLGLNFRTGDFDGFTNFEVSWIKNHNFSDFSEYVCACYQHNSEINYRKNSKFIMLHLHHMYMLFQTIYEDQLNSLLYTGAHKRIQKQYGLRFL